MLQNGSFYELSFFRRYAWIRRIKKLYSALLGPISGSALRNILAAAALVQLQFSIVVWNNPLVAFTILVINALLAYGLFHKKRWAVLLSLSSCLASIVLVLMQA